MTYLAIELALLLDGVTAVFAWHFLSRTYNKVLAVLPHRCSTDFLPPPFLCDYCCLRAWFATSPRLSSSAYFSSFCRVGAYRRYSRLRTAGTTGAFCSAFSIGSSFSPRYLYKPLCTARGTFWRCLRQHLCHSPASRDNVWRGMNGMDNLQVRVSRLSGSAALRPLWYGGAISRAARQADEHIIFVRMV